MTTWDGFTVFVLSIFWETWLLSEMWWHLKCIEPCLACHHLKHNLISKKHLKQSRMVDAKQRVFHFIFITKWHENKLSWIAWLKDKIESTKFALPALHFPHSLIPRDIWKACPTTTNGNEQSHRNINRDGTNLTVLSGIMRGQEYDDRTEASININKTYGINPRDSAATPSWRILRAVSRQGKAITEHRRWN